MENWTQENIDKLKNIVKPHKHLIDIANEMNMKKARVYAKIKQLNLDYSRERHYWTDEEIELLKKYKSEGYKHCEIGRKINRPAWDINRKSIELKLVTVSRHWPQERYEELKKLVSKGYTISQLRKYFRKGKRTIRQKLKELNIETDFDKKSNENKKLLEGGKRKCFNCDIVYPNTEEFFYRNRNCKHCFKKSGSEKRKAMLYNNDPMKIIKTRVQGSKTIAQRNGTAHEITEGFVYELYQKQNGLCYYTNTTMDLRSNQEQSLSIDRINSSIGYLKNNIVLCRKDVNYMKNKHSTFVFLQICRDVVAKFGSS